LYFARKLFIAFDNTVFSHDDLIEYYIQERISLLNNQLNSFLPRSQYVKLQKSVVELSRKRGYAVLPNRLDICFSPEGEFISHTIVRYINVRNTVILEKVGKLFELIQSGLYSRENTLALLDYSQEEYIPSMNLDVFFTKNLNDHKSFINNSILNKAFRKLIKSSK